MHIISRKHWGARDPRSNRSSQSPQGVRELFLHWPGEGVESYASVNTPQEEEAAMRKYQDFHMDGRGWADFAYSFAVFPSGRVYRGRGMGNVPAAQDGHNTNTVAVCVVLGTKDKLTPVIKAAVEELRDHCREVAGHGLRVRGHGEVTSTECPGPTLRAWLAKLNS